jgi:hypothetical protein
MLIENEDVNCIWDKEDIPSLVPSGATSLKGAVKKVPMKKDAHR